MKEKYTANAIIFAETGVFIEPEDPLECMNVLLDVILEELKDAS